MFYSNVDEIGRNLQVMCHGELVHTLQYARYLLLILCHLFLVERDDAAASMQDDTLLTPGNSLAESPQLEAEPEQLRFDWPVVNSHPVLDHERIALPDPRRVSPYVPFRRGCKVRSGPIHIEFYAVYPFQASGMDSPPLAPYQVLDTPRQARILFPVCK